ncbi:MAG: type II toxin-antitoxin system HigB family toxin [Microcoleus sp.]
MRLISRKNLLLAIAPYSDAQNPIESWYKLFQENDWGSLEEVRKEYSKSVDEVYGYTIFNIKGIRYRLIVRIKYRAKIIYFKKFLTHSEYNEINWNDESEVRQKIG